MCCCILVFDRNKMSTADLDLLRQYQPAFVLHPQEDVLPIEPSAYISACDLWQMKNSKKHFKLSDAPSSAMLAGLSRSGAGTSLALRGPPPRGDLGSRQISRVVRYDDGRTFLVYAVFFAFNDAVDVLGCLHAGAHQADLEFVVIDLGAHGNPEKAEKVWLSQHGDLVPHTPSQLLTDDADAATVFVAKGTHAMYTRAKRHRLFAGAAYDETRAGARWRPDIFHIVRPDDRAFSTADMGFTLYAGDMGDGHVSGFASQNTWTDPLTATETSKRR
jgi:hypothetical protein